MMDRSRLWTMTWRIALVFVSLLALFWTIWLSVVGSVPVITSIMMSKDSVWILPFAVSRWWDILLGLIFAFSVFCFRLALEGGRGEMTINFFCLIFMASNLLTCCVAGLIFGLPTGMFALGIGFVGSFLFFIGLFMIFWFIEWISKWTISQWMIGVWCKIWRWLIAQD